MRKIHLWISLVVGVLVWGAYFVHFAQSLRAGDLGGLVWWFVAALIVAAVAEAAATGLIARLFRRRDRVLDEGPTLQAALKAGHVALMLLVGLVLISALVLALSSVSTASRKAASSPNRVEFSAFSASGRFRVTTA